MINGCMFAHGLKRIWPYVCLLIVVILVSRANLTPYTTFGHSAGLDATRLFELDRGVRAGDLYPRWSSDMYFGYGSALLSLYAPLAYFVAEVFHLIGISMTWAIKLSYLMATLLAAGGMFLLGRHEYETLTDNSPPYQRSIAGIVAATCYILAPYFLVDLYVRAAVAELYGFGLIPWVIYFLAASQDGEDRRCLGAAAIAYGLLCFSHNISALLYSPAILGWILIRYPRKAWAKGGIVLATGLAIGAFFWLPALVLKNAVQSEVHLTTGYFSFDRHFIAFGDLFIPRWGYQPPGGDIDIMSLQLGLAHWALIIFGLAGTVLLRKRRIAPYLLMVLVSICFTQPFTRFAWQFIPLLKFVQFPWRFLMIATFASSILVAFVCAAAKNRFGKWAFASCAALFLTASIVQYLPYAKAKYLFLNTKPLSYQEVAPEDLADAMQNPEWVSFEQFMKVGNVLQAGITGMASDDFLPVAVSAKPQKPAEKALRIIEGSGKISDVSLKFNECAASVEAETPLTIVYETFYFPGWKARLNNKSHPTYVKANDGTILLRLPPGKHDLKIYYGNDPIHTVADIISLLGCIFALGLILYPRRQRMLTE